MEKLQRLWASLETEQGMDIDHGKGHHDKEYCGKEPHGKGHCNKGHRSKEPCGKGHLSKGHRNKGTVARGALRNLPVLL